MKKHFIGILSLVLTLALIAGVSINAYANSKEVPTMTEGATVVASPFTEAVAKVHDSVVGINVYTKTSTQSNSYGNDDSWGWGNGWGNWGFGWGNGWGNGNGYGYSYGNEKDEQESSKEVLSGSGSGVCIVKNYVVTCKHVVEDASSVKVAIGETEYNATVLATGESEDVAVLYVPDLPVEPVVVGDSETLQLGDWAICIGNPLGLYGTTTVGIISGLDREVDSDSTDAYGKKTTTTAIQMDAAINSGNSGGGLFNAAGELVGLTYMKYSGSSSSGASIEGISMAVPINSCKELINKALAGDVPTTTASDTEENNQASISNANTPRIGVTISNMNSSNYAVANNLVPNGAYVANVEEGSPAEVAGIQEGDIIVEIDGTIISNTTEMKDIISTKKAGDTLNVKLYRVEGGLQNVESYNDIPDGEYMDVTVTLAILDDVKQ